MRQRLADVGVTWLTFRAGNGRPRAFTSTDGSHLKLEGALAFGAELAEQLALHRHSRE
jgi:hypothetical protein